MKPDRCVYTTRNMTQARRDMQALFEHVRGVLCEGVVDIVRCFVHSILVLVERNCQGDAPA
jgi:hypothetical protein